MSKKYAGAKVRGIELTRDSIVLNGIISQSQEAMLIDGILDFLPMTQHGPSITAYRKINLTDHLFYGHFPGRPICPGHYQLQMAYQTALLFRFCLTGKTLAMPKKICVKDIANRNLAVPGDMLFIICTNPVIEDSGFACSVRISDQHGKVIAEIKGLSFSTEEFDPTTCQVSSNDKEYEFITANNQKLCVTEISDNFPLPHRGHALMIDGITAFQTTDDGFTFIDAISCLHPKSIYFSGSDFCQGHNMLEMAYLTAGLMHFCLTGDAKDALAIFRTENITFLRPALPGETLRITCFNHKFRKRVFNCSAALSDNQNRPIANVGSICGMSLK